MIILLLAFACLHEFSWQLLPWEYQGAWRSVTQWLLISWLCICAARFGRIKSLSATCIATSIMSSTTAICSAAWMIHPWKLQPGQWQCSQWLSYPVFLLSAAVSMLALWHWNKHERNSKTQG